MLVSAIHQHESATGIHMSPPSWTSFPPPSPCHSARLSQITDIGFFASYSKFLLALCFTYSKVYISMLLSQIIHLLPPLCTMYVCISFAKSLQSCPTLCDPTVGSPPGSPVPGILQARTLEWVAISFSSAWKWKVKGKSLSCVRLFATPWIAAYQAPPPMGFSRQEYWSGVPASPLLTYK